MWAERNPLGQFHSNNVAFQHLYTAPTGQLNEQPLPPSAGLQYYNNGLRTAAVATSVWLDADRDQAWPATMFMALRMNAK